MLKKVQTDKARRANYFPLVFSPLLCLVLGLGMWPGRATALEGRQRPNILFIMTDDQGAWAVNAIGYGQAQTPHIDRLFKQGARLTHMFTPTPVCSPSRASLMTSRHGTELGITDWIHSKKEPTLGLDPDLVTWPELLQQAGYTTGLVGKWHLGTQEKYHPTNHGYDYFMGFLDGGNTPKDPILEKSGEVRQFEGFTPDILTDHALAFIRRNQKAPFLLSVHYRAPHAAWLPVREADWAPFQEMAPKVPDYPNLNIEKAKRVTRRYLASVHSVDRNIGRLLRLLDDLGLAENTVVIFTSDHGYNVGHHGLLYKGNAFWITNDYPPATEYVPAKRRPNMFDTSIRVPAAVRWPGVIEPETVVGETLSFLDFYPTLLALAGVKQPKDVLIRGRSFLPLLKGKQIEDWKEGLYGEYSMHHGARTHMRMWRTPEWKLVRDFLNPERDELYHLATDPRETTNLIDSPDPKVQEVIDRLHQKILEKMRKIGDPILRRAKEHPASGKLD